MGYFDIYVCYFLNEEVVKLSSQISCDKAENENQVRAYRKTPPGKSKYLVFYVSLSDVGAAGDVKSNFRDFINDQIRRLSDKYSGILN